MFKKGTKMDINVSTSMGFSNQDFSRNTAKVPEKHSSTSAGSAEENTDENLFSYNRAYAIPQFEILSTSAMITLNNSLKETLKYLKIHSKNNKKKEPVFGELWDEFLATNAKDDEAFQGELYNFDLDENLENIFAA